MRVRAGLQALDLGIPPGYPDYVLHQMVTVMRGGEEVKLSKRTGTSVTIRELVEEVGRDAFRFLFLLRKHDSQLTFDIDLARTQSDENPVYYVQYAHARIASLRRKAGETRVEAALGAVDGGSDPDQALDPAERALINKLVAFPGEVEEAAVRRAPHRLAVYALELAQEFTAFYRDCRVVGAEPEAVESFRLALSAAAQRTIARALDLLGVTAPDEM